MDIIVVQLVALLIAGIFIGYFGYTVGRDKERLDWYSFLRDSITPENAERISQLAGLILTAHENGYLPEFTRRLREEVDKVEDTE
jgi:hypothetical protein